MKKTKEDFEVYVAENTFNSAISYLANRLSEKCSIDFDEAKQEMLIEAWKSYKSYDPNVSKFVTYSVGRMKKRSLTILHSLNKRQSPLHLDATIEAKMEKTPSVEDDFFKKEDLRTAKSRLDEIQFLLKQASDKVGGSYVSVYELFVMFRNEMRVDIHGRLARLTLTDACNRLGLDRSGMSRCWKEKVVILATVSGRTSIVKQIKKNK